MPGPLAQFAVSALLVYDSNIMEMQNLQDEGGLLS